MTSLITINYNNAKVTCELLASMEAFDREKIEVIVVDNASKEDPSEITKNYPWVKFIQSDKNLGFAGGNNLGVRHSTGDYLFFINNDTEFVSNIIDHLVDRFNDDPSLGIICPVLHYFQSPQDVQYAGFTQISTITGRNKCLTEVRQAGLSYTAYAHGAAMLMPRKVYDLVGPMPENYFVYYEEMDWSEEVRRKGFRIAVDCDVILYHKESQTVKNHNEMKSYLMTRNRILFMRRNTTAGQMIFFWIYFLLIATPKQILVYTKGKQWTNILAHIAGIRWNLFSKIDSTMIGYKFNYLGKI